MARATCRHPGSPFDHPASSDIPPVRKLGHTRSLARTRTRKLAQARRRARAAFAEQARKEQAAAWRRRDKARARAWRRKPVPILEARALGVETYDGV